MSNTSSKTGDNLNLLSFSGRSKILHMTWFAFFLSFVVWFSHAPMLAAIRDTMGLTSQQIKSLLIINVALTIPARILIGMLVDKHGPKLTYSLLLIVSGVLCLFFAMAENYTQLAFSRLMLGFVGAGFVIGIRMIGEWFPAKQVGIAEGIYGGWGNFGSAAAALCLPTLALWYGGDDGWRYAIGTTGIIAMVYGVIYYLSVHNTPKGSTYFKPKKTGAMEVSTGSDLVLYLVTNIPMYLALAILAWKLSPAGLGILSQTATQSIYAGLFLLYLYHSWKVYQINRNVLKEPVAEIHRYKFKQITVLSVAYLVTFGSELAVVSMLPLFFMDTFELSIVQAGMMGSVFAFMNLVARPGGGLISDKFGRKNSLSVLLIGLILGYFIMSQIDSSWAIAAAVVATMFCSFFVQAGEGAVFAIVPLVKRRMTGQVAGMTGAYGNVGGVIFLTVYSFVDPSTFFMVIAGFALGALIVVQFLDEPKGTTAEILPDGTVQMIEVS